MAPFWLRLRADIRLRWRPLVALALLLGVVGGVVLTAAAGARRTDTAYQRLLTWANASQVDVVPQSEGADFNRYATALARLPQVAAMSANVLYQLALPVPRGNPDSPVQAWAVPRQVTGVPADRVKILTGRPFDPAAAGQAMVDQNLAGIEHLRPGGTLTLVGVPNFTSGPHAGLPDFARQFPLTFTVTAVVAFDNQIVPAGAGDLEPTVLLSPAFAATKAARSLSFSDEAAVRLRPDKSMTAFLASASTLAKSHPDLSGLDVITLSDQVSATERAIRPEAIALAAFAALAGLIALAVVGQLLSRQLILDSAEYPVLRAVGMARPSLVALSLARLAVVTVTGAAIAVGIAIAASPLMPIGPARLAEPHPGVEVNAAVLGAGFAGIALIPLALLARAAWRAAGRGAGPLGVIEPAEPGRPSRLGKALSRAGSATGSIGVPMAFEPGHGRTAVPVRGALAGSVVAVAAVTAALVFGASLIMLVSTPRQYGQNWDQIVDFGFGDVPASIGGAIARAEPSITGYADGNYGQLTVDGQRVAAIGLDAAPGGGYVTMLAGRAPVNANEIALGAQTLRSLHRQVGQTVQVTVHRLTGGADTTRTMRVVGVPVFPAFSRGTFAPTGLGTGALVTARVTTAPGNADTGCVAPATCYNFFLLRYRPGTDLAAADANLTHALVASGCPIGSCAATADQRPGGIRNYATVKDTSLALGALLAVLAVGTLAHVLLTGVRRRRRDLAVLKTLGFTRSQVLRVVAWEASAFAAVALLVGLPLGVIAGRQAWAVFATASGVSAQAAVPLPLVLLVIPVTLAVANLIAAAPGWEAARVRPATVLRSE